MLDKELCKLFKVDPFMEWIQNKLDDLEDQIYSNSLEGDDLIRVEAQYNALKEARDSYWAIHIKKR